MFDTRSCFKILSKKCTSTEEKHSINHRQKQATYTHKFMLSFESQLENPTTYIHSPKNNTNDVETEQREIIL